MALIPDHLNDEEDVIVETRELSPSHFLFKIENFSLLSKNGIDKYETIDFVAGGYKWKLIFYPKGRDKGSKGGHISTSLAMSDTISLPATWEVNAVFTVFLLNQKLHTFQSMRGRARCFNAMKPEWGYAKFISRKNLTDPSSGYLVDDNCVFGAEVFVIKSQQAAIERLSILKDEVPYKHSLTISNYSTLEDAWSSEEFVLGNQTWCIEMHPKGNDEGQGRDVSIFLHLVDSGPYSNRKLKFKFTIRIKNQFTDKRHCTRSGSNWFTPPDNWGWPSFISIHEMNDLSKGFLVRDCCIVEVEVLLKAIARDSFLDSDV